MMRPRIVARRIGREGEPVAIIDGFASCPDRLRAEAAEAAFARSDGHYPGVKAPVPPSYMIEQRDVLAVVFREVFSVTGKVAILEASFAIVSAPAEALALEQRIPHTDGLAPGRLALVHFLVPGRCDGTAFFRHRRTGFETVDSARSPAYFSALNADLRQHGLPPPAYPEGDSPMFERTGHVQGLYNRALVYRSRMLHSGAIMPGRAQAADAATGRLTITGFFEA